MDATHGVSSADGNGLRLYVHRPAGGTGADEQLVVHPAMCRIANDPLVTGAGAPAALMVGHFRGGQVLTSVDGGADAYGYPLDFDADFPGEGGRYSADVSFVLPDGAAYRPFVDLAVSIRQPTAWTPLAMPGR